jgi:hypothetical protein
MNYHAEEGPAARQVSLDFWLAEVRSIWRHPEAGGEKHHAPENITHNFGARASARDSIASDGVGSAHCRSFSDCAAPRRSASDRWERQVLRIRIGGHKRCDPDRPLSEGFAVNQRV